MLTEKLSRENLSKNISDSRIKCLERGRNRKRFKHYFDSYPLPKFRSEMSYAESLKKKKR